MQELVFQAASVITNSRKALAISHIDADGITALAIIVQMMERQKIDHVWRNIHQLNSETIHDVTELIREVRPDTVIFSDLGTGQMHLIEQEVINKNGVKHVLVLDHHLPADDRSEWHHEMVESNIIEVNPCQHGYSGSTDLSGAGVAFLVALAVSHENHDLSELAIVGATGDLQSYYGRGFVGLNKQILNLAVEYGHIEVRRDLTFFGINTRPLAQLLQFATDPYIPGLTGDLEACYQFYQERDIELKDRETDEWRRWVDLNDSERQQIFSGLTFEILASYGPKVVEGIVGDVIWLLKRPPRSELSTAKEFSTMMNACGRNRRAEVGVKVCLHDPDAFDEGRALLHRHRMNLAMAIRRIETQGYDEKPGMYIVNDPETSDTIIGIVIGMALGSRIIPWDRPVIGISTNTTGESPLVKISGRAKKDVIKRGVNLKEIFVTASEQLNNQKDEMIAEAGGHPMAAGAFVHREHLDEFIDIVSAHLSSILN